MKGLSTTEAPKLAAILAIDVVGYSRLMREDEGRTLASLKAARADVIDPNVAACNGRLFKAMGDGFLLEFGSVANAVRCAIEIQQSMLARNEALPGGPKLEFRMGLNVADIIPDEDDVFGDGVNVAARLEALAAPSGICISGAVYEQIKHSAGDMFERVGPRALKNIEMPVEVYAVNFGRQRAVSQGNWIARMRRARQPFLIAGAIALLAAGAAAVSVIEFSPSNSGDSTTAAATQQPGAAADRDAAQAAPQTEAERIDAGAETEAAKAKARATIAVAKAEAGAAAAEAQAKAQLVERAVNAWKHASIALTEAAGQVSQAEAQLAELKARLAVLQESEPTALDGAEKTRLLDALKQRIASAQKDLEIIQVRHDAAVKAEKETAAHMGKLKADLSSAGN